MPNLPPEKISSANDFMVALAPSDNIVIMRRVGPLTKKQALNLAAYLVALADDKNEFSELLERVKN